MKLFNLFRMGLILSSVLLLAACGTPKVHTMPAKDVPQKNPHPKYFLTVKGYVAPSLMSKMPIVWRVRYYATRNRCREVINQFEGVSIRRSKTLTIVSHPNAAGDFENKLPLDYFLPGHCRWQVDVIGVKSKALLGNTPFIIGFFTPKKGVKPQTADIGLSCDANLQCQFTRSVLFKKRINIYSEPTLNLEIKAGDTQ